MKKKTFTLLELLVVLFIISLLLGIAAFRGDHLLYKEEQELDQIVEFMNHMRNRALIKNERIVLAISRDSIFAREQQGENVFSLKYLKPIKETEIIFTGTGATGQSNSYIFVSKRKNNKYELAVPVGFQRIRWKK